MISKQELKSIVIYQCVVFYKYTLGVEFGKYSLAQYRFAKDYYNIVIEEMENMK